MLQGKNNNNLNKNNRLYLEGNPTFAQTRWNSQTIIFSKPFPSAFFLPNTNQTLPTAFSHHETAHAFGKSGVLF